MSYIHVQQLSKRFQVRKKGGPGSFLREKQMLQALEGVSFDIEQGDLIGYIGPNGAGKSTTVKILSGILTPDEGEVLVGERIPWKNRKEYVKHIGVVFGQRMQLWWDVPILDSYSLLKDIYRIPESAYQKRLRELAEALNLGDLLRTPLRQMSLGQRMRAELCGSLLHQPEMLFLDEPTIGLDAVSKLALRDFLKWENREHRTTILLTTHDMEDIAALCPRVMVLGHGRKLYDGSLQDLLRHYDKARTVEIRYDRDKIVPDLPESVQVQKEGDGFRIVYEPEKLPTAELLSLLQQAGPIREMTVQPQNIDHLIADMYREMGL
ncbi:MAG: ATP-binding cassette domain-containing protein [Clostridia bacterium]|nr:ATP-binding cassette domain-containing protein [Clostridia bacterium]